MRNKKSGNSRFSAFLEGDKDRLFALPAESRDKDIPWDEALCEQRLREASLGGGEEPFHYTARRRSDGCIPWRVCFAVSPLWAFCC